MTIRSVAGFRRSNLYFFQQIESAPGIETCVLPKVLDAFRGCVRNQISSITGGQNPLVDVKKDRGKLVFIRFY